MCSQPFSTPLTAIPTWSRTLPDFTRRTTIERTIPPNPTDEWRYHDAPEYCVIGQELFDRVQAMIKPKERTLEDVRRMKRPVQLLRWRHVCQRCG